MTQAREKWDSENDFRHCYGHETHWQQDFERHPIIQAFTDRDQDTC